MKWHTYAQRKAEEPVFTDLISWMAPEHLFESFSFPQNDGTMWKSCGTTFRAEGSRQAGQFVLEVLALLNVCSLDTVRASALYCIPDAFYHIVKTIGNERQVRRKVDIIIDQEGVFELSGKNDAYELGGDLAPDGDPGVVDAVVLAHVCRFVQRGRRVPISDDEYVLRGKDFQTVLDRGWESPSSLVCWYQNTRLGCVSLFRVVNLALKVAKDLG